MATTGRVAPSMVTATTGLLLLLLEIRRGARRIGLRFEKQQIAAETAESLGAGHTSPPFRLADGECKWAATVAAATAIGDAASGGDFRDSSEDPPVGRKRIGPEPSTSGWRHKDE